MPKDQMDGWFLPRDAVNDLVEVSLNDTIRNAKQSHIADVILRLNGMDYRVQADWIKYMQWVGNA